MVRKSLLALATAAALGTSALTSTPASAHGIGPGVGRGPGHLIGHDFGRHFLRHGYWGWLRLRHRRRQLLLHAARHPRLPGVLIPTTPWLALPGLARDRGQRPINSSSQRGELGRSLGRDN